MGKVIKIGISEKKGKKIFDVNETQAVQGKGLINDRHYRIDNDKKCQITLIEIENINYYNKIYGTSIPSIDFRRNIITEGIRLNDLVGKEFFVGKIKVKAHDLCRPCKHLQGLLEKKNIIKEFLLKGGLRCEILTSGNIFVGDIIKQ
tara:strand:+ start:991 stop:1431 length:441 start_codon:yes stop_codon:yes gene_type:complete